MALRQHIFSLLACWGICPSDFSELLISSRQTLCRARFKSEASILGVEKVRILGVANQVGDVHVIHHVIF